MWSQQFQIWNYCVPQIKALHNNSKLSKLSSDEFGGLEPMGEVTIIVYPPNNTPPSLPVVFMLKCDNYSGPNQNRYINMYRDSIPIVPVIINSFDGENNECI